MASLQNFKQTRLKIVKGDEVLIKTEIVDPSYEQFYSSKNPVVKFGDIDPGQFVVKEELDSDNFGFVAEIKTEDCGDFFRAFSKIDKPVAHYSDEACKNFTNIDDFNQPQNNQNSSSTENLTERNGTLKECHKQIYKVAKIQGSNFPKETSKNNNEINGHGSNDEKVVLVNRFKDKILNHGSSDSMVFKASNSVSSWSKEFSDNSKPKPLKPNVPRAKKTCNDIDYRKRVESLIPNDLRFPVGEYKCYSCDENFSLLTDWEDHIIEFFKMSGCFPLQEINHHLKLDVGSKFLHTGIVYKCGDCPRKYTYKHEIVKHILTVHCKLSLKCALCPKLFPHGRSLKKHLSYSHDPTRELFSCKKCSYKSFDKHCLKSHVSKMHTNREAGYLKCDQCDMMVSSKQKLKFHLKFYHTSMRFVKKYFCSLCKYCTAHEKCLKTHMKNQHFNDVELFCFYCPYKTTKKHLLQLHILTCHIESPTKKIECDRCEMLFASTLGLKFHLQSRHTKKPESYSCSFCNATFTAKHQLFIHRNILHLSQYEYKCNLCKHSAKDKHSLRNHIFFCHSYTFYCHYCSFTTNKKLGIYSHINSQHNPHGDRFKCAHCKYVAKSKILLKQHTNVKHNPNPIMYVCHHCGHKNKIKHKLSQHMQTKHKDLLKRRESK